MSVRCWQSCLLSSSSLCLTGKCKCTCACVHSRTHTQTHTHLPRTHISGASGHSSSPCSFLNFLLGETSSNLIPTCSQILRSLTCTFSSGFVDSHLLVHDTPQSFMREGWALFQRVLIFCLSSWPTPLPSPQGL